MPEKKDPPSVVKAMTLAKNVALPLEQYTSLKASQIGKVVSLKLLLVGFSGFENYYPYQIGGGMRKRVGVVRAMSMDPEVLFFDEPSADLDPVNARQSLFNLSDNALLLTRRSVFTETVADITYQRFLQAQNQMIEPLNRAIADGIRPILLQGVES